jgi:hypothetical protein
VLLKLLPSTYDLGRSMNGYRLRLVIESLDGPSTLPARSLLSRYRAHLSRCAQRHKVFQTVLASHRATVFAAFVERATFCDMLAAYPSQLIDRVVSASCHVMMVSAQQYKVLICIDCSLERGS